MNLEVRTKSFMIVPAKVVIIGLMIEHHTTDTRDTSSIPTGIVILSSELCRTLDTGRGFRVTSSYQVLVLHTVNYCRKGGHGFD